MLAVIRTNKQGSDCSAPHDRTQRQPLAPTGPRVPRSGRGSQLYAKFGATMKRGGRRAAAEMAVVALEHIGKRYGTGAEILRDLSLSLEPAGSIS